MRCAMSRWQPSRDAAEAENDSFYYLDRPAFDDHLIGERQDEVRNASAAISEAPEI